MPTKYDIHQQVFSISMMSNNLLRLKGSQNDLRQQLENHLRIYLSYQGNPPTAGNNATDLIGDWTLTWGPVVYQAADTDHRKVVVKPPQVADNAMLVACNEVAQPDGSTAKTVVVAIAGTAAMSTVDWKKEDGAAGDGSAITGVVPWTEFLQAPTDQPSPPVAGEACISVGTATGLVTLLGMSDPSLTGSPTLLQHLATLDADTLIVTGHSLGGALSAALGLYLAQTGATPKNGTTYVYPTAGASPGNDAFAQTFAKALPPVPGPAATPWQSWNLDIWNTLDVVPQAWATDAADPTIRTLCNVNTIYGNDARCPTPLDISNLSARLVGWSTASGVTYKPVQGASFPGQTVLVIPDHPGSKTGMNVHVPPTDFIGFAAQALYQHGMAYGDVILKGQPALPQDTNPLAGDVTRETPLGLLTYFAMLFGASTVRLPPCLVAAE